MIDTDLNTWLIEANSSPAMDYSTHVTEKVVSEALNDLPKVIFDYPNDKTADTGYFRLLINNEEVDINMIPNNK